MKFFHLALIIIFSIGLSTASFAQITGGAKAGINFNSFRANNKYDVVPGFNVGGFAKMQITDFLKVRGELLYNQQGANLIDYSVIIPDLYHSNAKIRFHSVQIPVLAELGIPSLNADAIQPKLLLGGFYSYAVSTRASFVNVAWVSGYNPVEYVGGTGMNSYFQRSQYGIVGGIAGEIVLFSKPVSLEFRYQYNLNNVNKPGVQSVYSLKNTFDEWGDNLYLSTLSFNVSVTLF